MLCLIQILKEVVCIFKNTGFNEALPQNYVEYTGLFYMY